MYMFLINYLHFFNERWEATNGHECHEACNESAARPPCQNRIMVGSDVVKHGANTSRYDDIHNYS